MGWPNKVTMQIISAPDFISLSDMMENSQTVKMIFSSGDRLSANVLGDVLASGNVSIGFVQIGNGMYGF